MLAGEVIRKLDQDPIYGNLPEWCIWQVCGGWPIIPGEGIILTWLSPFEDVLPTYEQQFISNPLSVEWGSSSSYRQLRWYDTGLMGDWMMNHRADTFYVKP